MTATSIIFAGHNSDKQIQRVSSKYMGKCNIVNIGTTANSGVEVVSIVVFCKSSSSLVIKWLTLIRKWIIAADIECDDIGRMAQYDWKFTKSQPLMAHVYQNCIQPVFLNMVPSNTLISHLATQLGYSAGEFQALQLIVLAAFVVDYSLASCALVHLLEIDFSTTVGP